MNSKLPVVLVTVGDFALTRFVLPKCFKKRVVSWCHYATTEEEFEQVDALRTKFMWRCTKL